MSHSDLRFVRSFLDRFLADIGPAPIAENITSWFKAGEGTLFLDAELINEYRRVVQEILTQFAPHEDLSESAVDSALREVVFESVDISGQRDPDPEVRINRALGTLRAFLTSSPQEYECWVPIGGLDTSFLPASFGRVRFVVCDTNRISGLTARPNVESNAPQSGSVEHLEELVSQSWLDQPIALIRVSARDRRAAMELAERQARTVVECVNFFADLIPYNHAWLFILPPDQAKDGLFKRLAVAPDGSMRWQSSRVGPLGHLSLEKLRGTEHLERAVNRVENLLRKTNRNQIEKIIVDSVRWAGRASVADTLEESFLLFAISLECIVLPQSGPELMYRLSQRVARVLGETLDERMEIAKRTKVLYGIRSKIVHDGHYEVTERERDEMRMLAKRTVLRLLLETDVQQCAKRDALDHYFNKLTLE